MQKYHDFIERRKEERWRAVEREREEKEHNNTVISAADGQLSSFWCVACGRDYEAKGYKKIGTRGMWPVAWYMGKCPCGKWNMRRITDVHKDRYFWKSKQVQKDRRDVDYSMIDPNHELFPVIYPKQYMELEKKKYVQ